MEGSPNQLKSESVKLKHVQTLCTIIMAAPNRSINVKSAGFFRKDCSSRIRKYRAMKNMWKKKSKLIGPKYRKFVSSLQYYRE